MIIRKFDDELVVSTIHFPPAFSSHIVREGQPFGHFHLNSVRGNDRSVFDLSEIATGVEFVCRVKEFILTESNYGISDVDRVSVLIGNFSELSPFGVLRIIVRNRSTEGIRIERVAVKELELTFSVGSVLHININRSVFSEVRTFELQFGDNTANEEFVIFFEPSSDSLSNFVLRNNRLFFLNNIEESFVPAFYVTSGVECDHVVTGFSDLEVVIHTFRIPSGVLAIEADYFELSISDESKHAFILAVIARGEPICVVNFPFVHVTSYIVVDRGRRRNIVTLESNADRESTHLLVAGDCQRLCFDFLDYKQRILPCSLSCFCAERSTGSNCTSRNNRR